VYEIEIHIELWLLTQKTHWYVSILI